MKHANNLDTIQWENLPELLEACLPIWRNEISRIQGEDKPSKEDIELTIRLAKIITDTYTMCKVLQASVRRDSARLPPKDIRAMVAEYLPDEYRNTLARERNGH